MEKVIKKDEDVKREQAIRIIAEHVNNEYFTKRQLAEIVLDLALVQSTNAEMFVNFIHELCKKDEKTLWEISIITYLEALNENRDN